MKAVTLPALAAFVWLLAPSATSQVVISEINFSAQQAGDDQWVEVANLGSETAELNGWSLYLATKTPGRPGTYWFAFPQGTELEPAAFLRVHWRAPIPDDPPGPNEIYTGNQLVHFMFGYGAEILPSQPDELHPELQGGALALLSTQNNLLMNDHNIIQDWVSWGGNGYSREDLAIQAGKWSSGASVAPPAQRDSIALSLADNEDPTPVSAYFHDASPTPNAPNAVGSESVDLGGACSAGTLSPLILRTESLPVVGNRDFRFRLDNTLGGPNDFALLVLSPDPGDGSTVILGCMLEVGLTNAWGAVITQTQVGQTYFPFDMSVMDPVLSGLLAYVQAAVIRLGTPGDLATSDALKLILGS